MGGERRGGWGRGEMIGVTNLTFHLIAASDEHSTTGITHSSSCVAISEVGQVASR